MWSMSDALSTSRSSSRASTDTKSPSKKSDNLAWLSLPFSFVGNFERPRLIPFPFNPKQNLRINVQCDGVRRGTQPLDHFDVGLVVRENHWWAPLHSIKTEQHFPQ